MVVSLLASAGRPDICIRLSYRDAKKLFMALEKGVYKGLTPGQKEQIRNFIIDLGIEVDDAVCWTRGAKE